MWREGGGGCTVRGAVLQIKDTVPTSCLSELLSVWCGGHYRSQIRGVVHSFNVFLWMTFTGLAQLPSTPHTPPHSPQLSFSLNHQPQTLQLTAVSVITPHTYTRAASQWCETNLTTASLHPDTCTLHTPLPPSTPLKHTIKSDWFCPLGAISTKQRESCQWGRGCGWVLGMARR